MRRGGAASLTGTTLLWEGLAAECAALTRVPLGSSLGTFSSQPTIVTGTSSLKPEQKIELCFAGLVLGRLQTTLPQAGRVVGMDAQAHTVDLRDKYADLRPHLDTLQQWVSGPPADPPPVVLIVPPVKVAELFTVKAAVPPRVPALMVSTEVEPGEFMKRFAPPRCSSFAR